MCFAFGAPLEFSELSSKALCLQETLENGLQQKREYWNKVQDKKKIGKHIKRGPNKSCV
jgi:hypothetical protein